MMRLPSKVAYLPITAPLEVYSSYTTAVCLFYLLQNDHPFCSFFLGAFNVVAKNIPSFASFLFISFLKFINQRMQLDMLPRTQIVKSSPCFPDFPVSENTTDSVLKFCALFTDLDYTHLFSNNKKKT